MVTIEALYRQILLQLANSAIVAGAGDKRKQTRVACLLGVGGTGWNRRLEVGCRRKNSPVWYPLERETHIRTKNTAWHTNLHTNTGFRSGSRIWKHTHVRTNRTTSPLHVSNPPFTRGHWCLPLVSETSCLPYYPMEPFTRGHCSVPTRQLPDN